MEKLDQVPLEEFSLARKLEGLFRGSDLLVCLAEACHRSDQENG